MTNPCTHAAAIAVEPLPEAARRDAVCAECVRIGTQWVHLRQCLTCGEIGCCDSSPERHARAHAGAAGHPIVASAEPRERWRWCFVDDVTV